MQSFLIKGFDIGTSKITAIMGQYFQDEDKLNIVGIASSTNNGFKKGQMINLEQATNTFKQIKESVERMTGTKLDKAHIVMTGTHFETTSNSGSIVIVSSKNEITQEDVEKAVESSKSVDITPGREVIHTIPQKFKVDDQEGIIDPVGMTGNKLTVTSTIITASSIHLKNIQKALYNAGVSIDSISYSGLCNGYVAANNTERDLGCAIVDIGGSETTISIFTDGSLTDSFVIPVGDNNTTNDLAIGLRLPLDDAEQIKQTLQNLNIDKTPEFDYKTKKINATTAINGIIKPRIQELFELIDDQLQQRKISSRLQAGIILCGPGSLAPNIIVIASSITRLPIKIAQIGNVGGLMEDLNSPIYTTIIGLIRQQIQNITVYNKSVKLKSSLNTGNLITKFKRLIKPLLP